MHRESLLLFVAMSSHSHLLEIGTGRVIGAVFFNPTSGVVSEIRRYTAPKEYAEVKGKPPVVADFAAEPAPDFIAKGRLLSEARAEAKAKQELEAQAQAQAEP